MNLSQLNALGCPSVSSKYRKDQTFQHFLAPSSFSSCLSSSIYCHHEYITSDWFQIIIHGLKAVSKFVFQSLLINTNLKICCMYTVNIIVTSSPATLPFHSHKLFIFNCYFHNVIITTKYFSNLHRHFSLYAVVLVMYISVFFVDDDENENFRWRR